MRHNIKIGLERDRARLVERLQEARASKRGIGDIACGHSSRQQVADYEDAIARIDHHLRIIAETQGP